MALDRVKQCQACRIAPFAIVIEFAELKMDCAQLAQAIGGLRVLKGLRASTSLSGNGRTGGGFILFTYLRRSQCWTMQSCVTLVQPAIEFHVAPVHSIA